MVYILLSTRIAFINKNIGVKRIDAEYAAEEIMGDHLKLEAFTEYTVQFCGVTSEGCGIVAEKTVMTQEDGKVICVPIGMSG
ncbi:MAG: hypothetical protein DSY43_02670 [Gammaproteobacteria bacterium]|nr:MAG: hypothetical protein DSY43_02670 [Gammaproteobacteria bacterium]